MFKFHTIFLLLSLTFVGCDKPSAPPPTPATAAAPVVNNGKVITFVTMNSPNTYYVDGNNEFAGLEYDLAKLFVQELDDRSEERRVGKECA